jgi:hypothetical protein
MDWFVLWTQAYSAFSARNDYPAAIAQLKLLEDHPVCRNNLVRALTKTPWAEIYHSSNMPRANPKIVSYNVTNSLERFENKNSLFCLKKDLVYYNAGVVVVNLEVVAFALGPLVVM